MTVELFKSEPRWEPPVLVSTCPSCGTRRARKATNWSWHTDGHLRAHVNCGNQDCWRNWDTTWHPDPILAELAAARDDHQDKLEKLELARTMELETKRVKLQAKADERLALIRYRKAQRAARGH
jgi:hypothetical protein